MKLFRVYYNDGEAKKYLTVGNSKEEVQDREINELHKRDISFYGYYVSEIDEVDGHKIIVE